MDRFGLRVIVRGLTDPEERLEAYQRVSSYHNNPKQILVNIFHATQQACDEIEQARHILPEVSIPRSLAQYGIQLIQRLEIDSLRAEISLFESARALAASDGRLEVQLEDLRQLAPLALRLRRSDFMQEFVKSQIRDDEQINHSIEETISDQS